MTQGQKADSAWSQWEIRVRAMECSMILCPGHLCQNELTSSVSTTGGSGLGQHATPTDGWTDGHTHTHARARMHTLILIHTYTYTHTYTLTHSYIHMHTLTFSHTHMHRLIYSRAHTEIFMQHTHMCARVHTHTHSYILTHSLQTLVIQSHSLLSM